MFNPFEPGYAADPYPHYREQRETEPVQHLPIGPWIVFEHAECTRLLRDTSLSVDARKARAIDPEQETVRQRIIAEVAPGRIGHANGAAWCILV